MKGSGSHPLDALDRFTDPGLLEELEGLQSEGDALALMVREGWPLTNLSERMRRYVELQKQILDSFEAALAAGDLIATGYDSRSASMQKAGRKNGSRAGTMGRRTTIPCEMWRGTLALDYERGTATGGGLNFAAVLIRAAARGNILLERACLSWLKEEVAKGYRPRTKPDMWEKVLQKYGNEVSQLAFEERIWPQVADEEWRKRGRKIAREID